MSSGEDIPSSQKKYSEPVPDAQISPAKTVTSGTEHDMQPLSSSNEPSVPKARQMCTRISQITKHYFVYLVAFVVLRFALEPMKDDSPVPLFHQDHCAAHICRAQILVFDTCKNCSHPECTRKTIFVQTRYPFNEKNQTPYVDIDVPNIIIHPRLIRFSFQTTFLFHWLHPLAVNVMALKNLTAFHTLAYTVFRAKISVDNVRKFIENIDRRNYSRISLTMAEFGAGNVSFANEFGGITFGVKFRFFESVMRLYFCSHNICKRHGPALWVQSNPTTDEYFIEIIQFVDSDAPCSFRLYEPLEAKASCRTLESGQNKSKWAIMD